MLSLTDTEEINIAIDGETASDKTSVGKLIAEKLHYQFINTAAILAENDEIHETINSILHEITKEKEFVVVGKDVTFNILPKAKVKILLSADLNIRALRQAQQLDSDNITNNILLNIINHDSKAFTLFAEAKRVSKLIDTTELTLADVVDLILTQINPQSEEIVFDKKLTNEEEKAIRKQQISNEEIESYIEIKNWKLSNEVDIYTFEIAFHELDEELNFMRKLLEYYNACVTKIKNIESKMPKNRNHSLFFKAKTWHEKILKGPKAENQTIRVRKSLRILKKASLNYCVTCQYIKKQFLQTENNYNISSESLIDVRLESPTSIHSYSTYITDDEFVEKDQVPNNESLKTRYIFKQNEIVNSDKINFSDDEMQLEMDDEQDNLPTEHDALKNFFG
ncbi:cytidylate kinase [Gigaspora margarita]|uniref:(d)CMP kinase n=1 Tax=Gigaspora margarita TaxID=4874 RepID=A0A8H3XMY8_GIGMA|nr:cytidylate kinase [Gigaspora margarita]